jgi:hypothetical protein
MKRWRPRWRTHRGVTAVLCALVVLALFGFHTALTQEKAPTISGQPKGETVVLPPAPVAPEQPSLDASPAQDAVPLAESRIPEEALWDENGELLSPLPSDPVKRAEAIAQARARAASLAPPPGEIQSPGMSASSGGLTVEPLEATPRNDLTPGRAPSADMKPGIDYNLSLPAEILERYGPMEASAPAVPLEAVEDPAGGGELAPQANALRQDFHGIDDNGTLVPPDPDLAAGPEHIIEVVNSRFAIFDKCGNKLVEQTFASFTGNTNFLFDPKVIWDDFDQRWIMIIAARDHCSSYGRILVIPSKTANPLGGWWVYAFDFTLDGGAPSSNWADYPDVEVDTDGIYVTTNQFSFDCPGTGSSFAYAKCRVLQKSQVYVGGAAGWVDFWNQTNPADGSPVFCWRPVKEHAYPGLMYLVNNWPGSHNIISIWRITGPPNAPALGGVNVTGVASYQAPPPIVQPNATLVDAGDARLLNAVYRNTRIWASQSDRHNWGEAVDRSAIRITHIDTGANSVVYQGNFGAGGYYYCFPAVDFDAFPTTRGIVVFARGGPSEFVGARYADQAPGGPWGSSAPLQAGQTNYSHFPAPGTPPYRWGDYLGCARDPFDDLMLWFVGQFASSSPNPSWDTWIGATSFEAPGQLIVSPIPTFVSTGLVGGPFTPGGVLYNVQNTGGTGFSWTLSGVNTWNSASSTDGQLLPGGNTFVSVNINALANGFGPGTYTDTYQFNDCYSGAYAPRATELTVGIDGSCPGAVLNMIPPVPPPNSSGNDNQERGIYITAIQDFRMCAFGMMADLELPQTLTARLYAADNNTRGALLATGTLTAVQAGNVMHYIPISYTLRACQDYDLAIEFGTTNSWPYWTDNNWKPFDVGGAIRMRDAEYSGGAGNSALPYYSIIGQQPPCEMLSDLGYPGGPTTDTGLDNDQDRGIYVTAKKTMRLCSFGWEADLVPPQTLTARVYEATGTVRGAQIAEGTLNVTTSGMQFHDIPINAVLYAEQDYDITVEFGTTNSWDWWDENTIVEPYTIDDAFEVVDAEFGGDPINFALPHYRASWGPAVGGTPFDLSKPAPPDSYPPDHVTSQDFSDYGAYVTSLIDQEVFALGWAADVPEGEPIGANIFEATGTTRGALIASGMTYSDGPGTKWHDIPIAASLVAGQEYDLEIDIGQVTEWRWWHDGTGLPYDVYGVIRVRDSDQEGNPANSALIHMRMFACDERSTPVVDPGTGKPRFHLSLPEPNPVTTTSLIRYSLAREGPVTMRVYDVQGKRVETLIDGANRPAGPNFVRFDSSRMAAGVYFLRLENEQQKLTRKMIVVH